LFALLHVNPFRLRGAMSRVWWLCAMSIVTETATTPAHNKTALVTGAAGFVGSHVARHCLSLGMRVIAMDDLSGGFLSNLPDGVRWFQGDIKDPLVVERIFSERIDYVYHLAAYAAEGLSHFVRSFNYRTNLVGSIEILNQAIKHKIECFVFTSSIAVYGSQMRDRPQGDVRGLTEEDPPSPEDPYGISKYAVEMDLRAAHELYGIDFVVFRPHNVYGPNQNMFDKYRNVVGIFINQMFHGLPMTIFGDGEQVRAFSFIDDVAPIIANGPLLPAARNQVFNVGADVPYTVNQLSRATAQAMGLPTHPIDRQPARMEVGAAVSNHDRVKSVFGPPPPVSLQDGLNRTVAWFRNMGRGFRPVEFQTVEIKRRMPPSWLRPDLRETAYCDGSVLAHDANEVKSPEL